MQHEAATFILQDGPADGKSLEDWVMQAQARFGVWLLEQLLTALDKTLFQQKPAEWRCEGFRTRTIETVVGTVSYQRRVYRHRVSGEWCIPVDEYVGWSAGERVSPQVKQWCTELATVMPFRTVSDLLWKLRRVKVSHASVHQKTQEMGERRVEEVRKEVAELDAKPGESPGQKRCPLFLEVDSTFARSQRRKKGEPGHIEMRLAVSHEGWEAASPAGKRYRLKAKRVVVGATQAETFWQAVSAALAQEYDLAACPVIINGDGAAWIRQGVEYFPQAVFQLDQFHWLRALRRAVGHNVPALRQMRGRLEKGDWAGAEQLVQAWKQKYPERAGLLDEFWQYVWANRESLGDWRQRVAVELEIARGLGAAESNIDAILVSRFKRRRRSWSVAGANRLGHLVALRHNGRLSEWLKQEPGVAQLTENSLVSRAKRYHRYKGKEAAAWLQASVPLLGTKTTPGVIAIRGLSLLRPSWVA